MTIRPTIFALATGAPPTAIAVIRISGSLAFATLQQMVSRPVTSPRQLFRRTLHDPLGDQLDDALVVIFPAPASATGDDLVELHLHGGPAVIAAVLSVLDGHGLRAAPPGGFTRRAFDNGKLNLGHVEGLRDLIAAETESQRRAALARTGSDLAQRVDRWRVTLNETRADAEAMLDFAEEDGVGDSITTTARTALGALRQELTECRGDAVRGAVLRDGVTIALVGSVNVGKSTLLNALAGRDAAMVSVLPGTTRDVVEVRLNLSGTLVNLLDTAGSRDTRDPLEAEAIRRGMARASDADVIVALGPCERDDAIIVASKCDLIPAGSGWRDGVLHLSAATGAGLDLLRDELARRAAALVRHNEPPLVASRWQSQALDAALASLGVALETTDAVLLADELRRACAALDRLIGKGSDDELLDTIFARFCIGK